MRQPTTAEVRLDEHKTASFGPAGPSILPFWLSTSRLRSNFVAAELPGTEDRDQQLRYPGNVGGNGGDHAGTSDEKNAVRTVLLSVDTYGSSNFDNRSCPSGTTAAAVPPESHCRCR